MLLSCAKQQVSPASLTRHASAVPSERYLPGSTLQAAPWGVEDTASTRPGLVHLTALKKAWIAVEWTPMQAR